MKPPLTQVTLHHTHIFMSIHTLEQDTGGLEEQVMTGNRDKEHHMKI